MKPILKEPGKLGMASCIMLLIGVMIGSAIFSLSGLTILTAGPAAVLSWLIAGLIMLGYGMCMAELACRYPKSGGVYYFPRYAYEGRLGRWLGWISAWSFILTNLAAVAFSAIYVGIYLSVAFPCMTQLQLPLAIASILFCLVMNLIRVDTAGKLNTLLVAALLVAMLIYVFCALSSGSYNVHQLCPFFTQGTDGALGFAAAVPIGLIGYSGIIALAFMASEVRQARRTIPAAMFIAILFVTLIYFLMILSTAGLISAEYLKANPEMRFIPMFAACFTKLANLPWLTAVVSVAAVLALMTTMGVCTSINARALEAAAEDGILPRWLNHHNRQDVPDVAAMLTCLVAAGYCCFPEYTQQIVNFGALFNVFTMVIAILALLRARRRIPDCGFSAPGGKLLPYFVVLVLVLSNVAGIFTFNGKFWLYTAGLLALGCVIFFIAEYCRGRE